jgi:hypothetical protein
MKFFLLVITTLVASGCNRLDHIGQPPPLSPAGQVFVEPLPVTAERVALATPEPVQPLEIASREAPPDRFALAFGPNLSVWRSASAGAWRYSDCCHRN